MSCPPKQVSCSFTAGARPRHSSVVVTAPSAGQWHLYHPSALTAVTGRTLPTAHRRTAPVQLANPRLISTRRVTRAATISIGAGTPLIRPAVLPPRTARGARCCVGAHSFLLVIASACRCSGRCCTSCPPTAASSVAHAGYTSWTLNGVGNLPVRWRVARCVCSQRLARGK